MTPNVSTQTHVCRESASNTAALLPLKLPNIVWGPDWVAAPNGLIIRYHKRHEFKLFPCCGMLMLWMEYMPSSTLDGLLRDIITKLAFHKRRVQELYMTWSSRLGRCTVTCGCWTITWWLRTAVRHGLAASITWFQYPRRCSKAQKEDTVPQYRGFVCGGGLKVCVCLSDMRAPRSNKTGLRRGKSIKKQCSGNHTQ